MFPRLGIFCALLMCSIIAGQDYTVEEPVADYRTYPTVEEQQKYPPNGCYKDYGGRCPNLCTRYNQTCCYCQECFNKIFGLTQSCTCCPEGYECCPSIPPAIGRSQKCCPKTREPVSYCGPTDSKSCSNWYKPIFTAPVCQICSDWSWPPRWYAEAEPIES